jgi:hypothetical protein
VHARGLLVIVAHLAGLPFGETLSTANAEADPADYLLHAAWGYVSAALAYLAAASGERNLSAPRPHET